MDEARSSTIEVVGRPRVRVARRRALIIGGGVSGCACASTLADAGTEVVVVSCALDHVGEPDFGPIFGEWWAGQPAAGKAFECLPAAVRDVWMGAMLCSEAQELLVVDRRLVGIETKRTLELMGGVEFRQGTVVGIGVCERNPVSDTASGCASWARTSFEETFEAEAVVVAVGLGIGEGSGLELNTDLQERRGAQDSDGLRDSLRRLGAEFAVCTVRTGPSFTFDADGRKHASWRLPVDLTELRSDWGDITPRKVALRRMDGGTRLHRQGGPDSPYAHERLWSETALVGITTQGAERALLVPDGIATNEMALCQWSVPRLRLEGRGSQRGYLRGAAESRSGRVRRELKVVNSDRAGRIRDDAQTGVGIWVTGRSGGAESYLESLAAGVRTGQAVEGFLEASSGKAR